MKRKYENFRRNRNRIDDVKDDNNNINIDDKYENGEDNIEEEDEDNIKHYKEDSTDDGSEEDSLDTLQRYLYERYPDNDILEFIQRKPNSVQQITDYREYTLHIACQYDHPDNVIMKLIELFPIAARHVNSKGDLPLHIACRNGQSKLVVMKLIEIYPLAVETKDRCLYYPLHLACTNSCCNNSIDVVKKLLEIYPEAAYKVVKSHGYALHLACKNLASEAVIRKLVEVNPKALNKRIDNNKGYYPIHITIDSHRIDNLMHDSQLIAVIRYLLEADPIALTRQTLKGESPIHMACTFRTMHVVELILQHSNVIRNSNIILNIKDRGGMTALHRACMNCKYPAITKLLEHPDIHVNARDNVDETPLHKVVRLPVDHSVHVIQQLFDHSQISINTRNKHNKTPLELIDDNINQIRLHLSSSCGKYDDNVMMIKKQQQRERQLQLFMEKKDLFEKFEYKKRWLVYQYCLSTMV